MKAFEKNIRKVEPYVPGEQPQRKVIKLNTNENPYAPAPGVTKALEEMNTDRLRLYPDPTAAPLVNALADFYNHIVCIFQCIQRFRQSVCFIHFTGFFIFIQYIYQGILYLLDRCYQAF